MNVYEQQKDNNGANVYSSYQPDDEDSEMASKNNISKTKNN